MGRWEVAPTPVSRAALRRGGRENRLLPLRESRHRSRMRGKIDLRVFVIAYVGLMPLVLGGIAAWGVPSILAKLWTETAAGWAQAVFSVAAIMAAWFLGGRQMEASRESTERQIAASEAAVAAQIEASGAALQAQLDAQRELERQRMQAAQMAALMVVLTAARRMDYVVKNSTKVGVGKSILERMANFNRRQLELVRDIPIFDFINSDLVRHVASVAIVIESVDSVLQSLIEGIGTRKLQLEMLVDYNRQIRIGARSIAKVCDLPTPKDEEMSHRPLLKKHGGRL